MHSQFPNSPNPSSWGGPITSPATFRRAVEDGLFEARRLADANQSAWIYQSIAGLLEGLLQFTADGRRPKAGDRQTVQSMAGILQAQAGDADPGLLRLVESALAYFREWPAVTP